MSLRGGGEALQGGHTCRDRGVTPGRWLGRQKAGSKAMEAQMEESFCPPGEQLGGVLSRWFFWFFLKFLAAVEEVCRLMRSVCGFCLRLALLSIPGGMLLRMPPRSDTQGQ